jgi:hypothetical protein
MRKESGNKFEGVTWHEEDREGGPFMVRICGTNEFVSKIDPHCDRSWPPGYVELVQGWDNPLALKYDSMEAAKAAGAAVMNIEGYHNSIEPIGSLNL